MDVIGQTQDGTQARGGVAERLLASGFNVNALKTNAVLRKEEWKAFDTAVVDVAQERLVGAADLIARGQVFNVSNALGTTYVEWEEASDLTPAQLSMDGVTRSQSDRQEFDLKAVPLPIFHKDFFINIRALEASRKRGDSLDVSQAQRASRNVSELIEETLFQGANTLTIGNGTIYGYTDFPGRNTGVTIATAWDQISSNVGTTILSDVLDMIDAAHTDLYFGPYMLYVPSNYWVTLMDDFKAESDKTTIQRIRELDSIIDVKVSDKLPNDNVVLVQMTSDVVDMVVGQGPTTIQWEVEGGMRLNFKAMSIMVPRLKQDFEGRTGIVHATT